jgi:hypothetical protein
MTRTKITNLDIKADGVTDGYVFTASGGNGVWKPPQTASGGVSDHGQLVGLGDDDHSQYHTDARGDARYYTETELDAGQLDNRYYTETEHINSSAGAGDSGKPVVLDADGNIDASMINDADIDHVNLTNTHNLTTDIDHDQLTNTHNLTTDIDHDALTNFESNEHINFTASGIETIHPSRITISGVTQHEAELTITEVQIIDLSHYTSSDFDTDFGGKSTTNLSEGTNLYFTDERVDDRVNNLLIAGDNIALTYNDGANTLTISGIGNTDTQLSEEQVQDFAWNVLTGTQTLITVTYDDNNNEVDFVVVESGIDHNNLSNTHNLTSDIDHDQLTNTHNLTTDIDHGSITGLGDDDHTQYHNDTRHDSHDHSTALGSTILSDVGNVTLTMISDGDLLVFDIGTSGWINVNPSTIQQITARKNSGSNVGTRPRLNFIEGNNVTITMADDSGDDEIDITISSTGGGATTSGNLSPVFEYLTNQVPASGNIFTTSNTIISGSLRVHYNGLLQRPSSYTQESATTFSTTFSPTSGDAIVADYLVAVGSGIVSLGFNNFLGLTDTPSTYSGQAGKYTKVNNNADALEFSNLESTDLNSIVLLTEPSSKNQEADIEEGDLTDFDSVSPTFAWDQEADLEEGDLTDFDATSGSGLSAAMAAAISGTYGLSVSITDTSNRRAILNGPSSETQWVAECEIDPSNLTMATNDVFIFMLGANSDGAGTPFLSYCQLIWNGSNFQVQAVTRDDGGSFNSGTAYTITAEAHTVRIIHIHATGPGNNDGETYLYVDGSLVDSITGLDTDANTLGSVAWGAAGAVDSGTSGTLYLDTMRWSNDTTAPYASEYAALSGSYGMAVGIEDTTARYASLTDPAADTQIVVEGEIDPNGLTMANGDSLWICDTTPSDWLVVVTLNKSAGNYQLQCVTFEDGTVLNNVGSAVTISDAKHTFRVVAAASTGPGNDDGYAYFYVDGVLIGSATGLDNDGVTVDTINFGAVASLDSGTFGVFYMDNMWWSNDFSLLKGSLISL